MRKLFESKNNAKNPELLEELSTQRVTFLKQCILWDNVADKARQSLVSFLFDGFDTRFWFEYWSCWDPWPYVLVLLTTNTLWFWTCPPTAKLGHAWTWYGSVDVFEVRDFCTDGRFFALLRKKYYSRTLKVLIFASFCFRKLFFLYWLAPLRSPKIWVSRVLIFTKSPKICKNS